jgi:hypothetical protein
MSLISDGSPKGDRAPASELPPLPGRFHRPGTRPAPNAVRASQARAALRREARRDELAVAHWLRELASSKR